MNILLIFPGFIVAFIILFYYEHKIKLLKIEPINKVHFYIARDKDRTLCLHIGKPFRGLTKFCPNIRYAVIVLTHLNFKSFGLNPDDFKNLKWEDEPVEVLLNLED